MRYLMTLGRIASYIWLAIIVLVVIAFAAGLLSLGKGGTALILVIMGLLQLPLVWHFWPRNSVRCGYWKLPYRYPGRPRGGKPGATLASVTVALLLIAICLTMLTQAYVHGSRAQRSQARRTLALAIAQEQIETLRAHGYAAVPGIGRYGVRAPEHRALRGTVRIQTGPVAASREVTVTVRWPRDERVPAGNVSLSTVISARGVGG